MDRFVVKSSQLSKSKSHTPTNISAADRSQSLNKTKFPVHEHGGLLFCSICNCTIDHLRLSVIKQHMSGDKHLKRKTEIENDKDAKKKKMLQTTVDTAIKTQMTAKDAKQEVGLI